MTDMRENVTLYEVWDGQDLMTTAATRTEAERIAAQQPDWYVYPPKDTPVRENVTAPPNEEASEVRNGVCVRCGSGVTEAGEHIRSDLPPCYGVSQWWESRKHGGS